MAYKSVTYTTTVDAAISDAFSALDELGSECREIADNASEGLSQTQRIQTLGETADTLEGLSAVDDIPEAVKELPVSYPAAEPTRKRQSPSRAVRCGNAVTMLQAGIDTLTEWIENNPEHESVDDVQGVIDEVEQAIGEAEGCEFPGMFG